jgi:tetratricopeptide (TPR) repeat protein
MLRTASPEEYLQKAMAAKSARSRGLFARRGLASRSRLDKTTHAMLLRQLYLAHFEAERFEEALDVAKQALTLEVLSDVIAQDAARAASLAGHSDEALQHLRAAARKGPASRRAFHHWTLGSMLYLLGRHAEAERALERAARWGTNEKPLFRGHLALVRLAQKLPVPDLDAIVQELSEAPCGQGYGRFVLGQLAYASNDWETARAYLSAFVRRSESGRASLALALRGELTMARSTLAKMAAN